MKTVNLKGQEWATKNFDTRTFRNGDLIPFAKTPEEFKEFTSSKKACFTYYNYDENNYSKYGCCYNWFSVVDKRGLAPEGFKIPDNEDFSLLLDNYIGRDRLDDDMEGSVEGREKLDPLKKQLYSSLKSNEIWNEDISGTDTFGFSLLPVPGIFESRGYNFPPLGDSFQLWSSTKDSKYRWELIGLYYMELRCHPFKASKKVFMPNDCASFIRLIKDIPIEKFQNKEVEIGSQIWLNSNLNVDKFNNGDLILEAKSKEEWDSAGRLSTPAWCFYKNDENNGKIYGKLYNWFAVNDPRGIAPNGFKIPSKEDFQLLIHQLNGQYYSKEKLKSKKYWQKDLEGTDSSGFNAIPSGRRDPYFEGLNENTSFWTATESKHKNYALAFQYSAFGFLISESPKFSGYSMRVLKI